MINYRSLFVDIICILISIEFFIFLYNKIARINYFTDYKFISLEIINIFVKFRFQQQQIVNKNKRCLIKFKIRSLRRYRMINWDITLRTKNRNRNLSRVKIKQTFLLFVSLVKLLVNVGPNVIPVSMQDRSCLATIFSKLNSDTNISNYSTTFSLIHDKTYFSQNSLKLNENENCIEHLFFKKKNHRSI